MIRWFANNEIAANFLMLAILIAGGYTALFRIPLEVSPALSWETVMIEMPYRGATAKDVEKAILIPIEEALEGVKGIEHLNADGYGGTARLYLRAAPGTDLRAMLEDVKGRVDTITTFPAETERPRIFIPDSTSVFEVLNVAVTGDMNEHDLNQVARRVVDDLVELPGISRATISGQRLQEISIEASSDKLESYNLSFQDLADAIRRFSIDLPAGSIDSPSGTFIVRTRGQAYAAQDFAQIPIRSNNGSQVRLGDVATIDDGFEQGDKRVEFNGKPALFIEVMRTGSESAIDISDKVRAYVASADMRFPEGVKLFVWDDESLSIRGRLSTLVGSMLQGSFLVLIVLGLFLRPMLAFWIVLGIPVALAGGVLTMPWFGLTFNAMSLFGFIIVVGIVVDDAIVTGENVYSKIQAGVPPLEAAVDRNARSRHAGYLWRADHHRSLHTADVLRWHLGRLCATSAPRRWSSAAIFANRIKAHTAFSFEAHAPRYRSGTDCPFSSTDCPWLGAICGTHLSADFGNSGALSRGRIGRVRRHGLGHGWLLCRWTYGIRFISIHRSATHYRHARLT